MCANGQAPQNTSGCVCFVSNAPMLRHSCDAKSTYAPSPPPFSARPGAEQPRTPPQWPGATICWSPRRTDVTLPASDRDLSSLARVAMRVLYLV
jgi:hypothetical protein